MALTLSQYKAFAQGKISPIIIDEIRKSSYLLDNIPIPPDAIMTDSGGRQAWVYTYSRNEAQRELAVRQVNNEYVPAEVAAAVDYSVELTVFGGAFEVDRVTANLGYGRGETVMERQIRALTSAVPAKFADLLINADSSVAGEGFDGLDLALAGTTTEYGAATHIDLSDAATIETNAAAFEFALMEWLGTLDGQASALLVNSAIKPRVTMAAKKRASYTTVTNEFGQLIEVVNNVPIIDIGNSDGTSNPIIPIESRDYGSGVVTGLTDIYAVRFGADGLHAVAPEDKSRLVKVYLPNMELPGAVKLGEVEVVTAIALESTKAAGVFRNVKVA